MRILISNDDGIGAPGLRLLTEVASQFGTVYVAAPAGQCSAMSQRLSIFSPVCVREEQVPFAEKAWSLEGTPADCVKIALTNLMEEKPDLVLSGINDGFNAGFDIPYSGTVGAAMEALMGGVPAIAVSVDPVEGLETARAFLPDILEKLIGTDPGPGCIHNVNIPGIPPEEIKGVLRGVRPAPYALYEQSYSREAMPDGGTVYRQHGRRRTPEEAYGDYDCHYLVRGYITVGPIRNMSL